MPVLLSDETWARIEKMLGDYDAGLLYITPGSGLKTEEEVTTVAKCPTRKIGLDLQTMDISVCVNGSPQTVRFFIKPLTS